MTAPASGNPFLDPIIAAAAAAPQAPHGAFRLGGVWQEVTRDAFLRRAAQYAALLAAEGVAPGAVVPIILRTGLDSQAAFIGAMLAGCIPSFLPYPNAKHDHALYWQQHRTLLTHINPGAVIVYDELVDAVAACAAGTGARILAQSAADGRPDALPARLPPADAVGLLQHSSGTTGLKKGVALSYHAIRDQLAAYHGVLGMPAMAAPSIASWLPLYHDMGLLSSFLLPVWAGIPVATLDPFEWVAQPGTLFEAVERYRATHAWLPNFAFLHLARMARDKDRRDLSSLIALTSCSEPCKPEAFDAFLARFAGWGIRPETLQTCYAMAETVFAVSQSPAGQPARRLTIERAGVPATLLSNGPALPGVELAILADGAFLPEGQTGEICVRAPFLFDGYYRNPAATEAAFHDGWYRTGDIGFVEGGEIFIAGRLKDLIIVNGKNILAHDVEAAVSRIAAVKPGRAVAFGHYDARMGSEQLVVLAEAADAASDPTDMAQAINRAVLDEVGIPCSDVQIVDQGWLVKTTSGKISRSENARRYGEMWG